MKIAQVCHRYHPNVGGVEKHVQEISERLVEKHDVEVISADRSGGPRTEVINGVNVTRFRSFSPGNAYFISPQIYAYIKKSDFDIVHAHNYHAFPALFAALASKDEKFVFNPHYHGVGSTPFRNLLNKPYKRIGSKIFERADRIICDSNYERGLVEKDFGIDERGFVIPSGIDLEEIKRAEPFEFDGRLVLYLGRLDRYKNVDRVVEAMKHLPEDVCFYIGGTGGHQSELKSIIEKLNLDKRVKLLGFVLEEDKYRLMKTSSLFVNLSGTEAFGITVLEALAAGAPAVVNSEGGLREFAEKFDGVLSIKVDDASSEELAKAIEESIGKRFKNDFSSYDWGNITNRLEQVYVGI